MQYAVGSCGEMSELLFHGNGLVSSVSHLRHVWNDPSRNHDNSAHGSYEKWIGSGLSGAYNNDEPCCPLVVDYIDFLVILLSIAGATALLWLTMNNCCFRDPTMCADSTNCPAIMGRRRKRSPSMSLTLQGKKNYLLYWHFISTFVPRTEQKQINCSAMKGKGRKHMFSHVNLLV